jgi:hypothetical protein
VSTLVPTPPERPNRRITDGGPTDTPRARQGRLVRFISGDPILVDWLATSKARTLMHVAAQIGRAGHPEAAELVRQHADDLTSGKTSPF